MEITAGNGRVVPDLTKNGSIRATINSLGPTLCPPGPGLFLFAAVVNIALAH